MTRPVTRTTVGIVGGGPGATDFDLRRQPGELKSVAGSVAGSTYLAEAYTGWPSRSMS